MSNVPSSSRALVDTFVADPEARSIETIQRHLAQLRYPTAAVCLLARARCNESVPIDLVCEVIARADTLSLAFTLFLIADGDRVAAIVDMIETDAFPHDAIGMMLTAGFVLAADKLDGSHNSRPRLAAGVRVFASACLDLPPSTVRTHIITAFQLVATQLEDSILAAMLPSEPSGPLPVDIVSVQQLMRLSRVQILGLPAPSGDSWLPAVQKVEDTITCAPVLGRNAPCWCQSGKKFKRCHGADERPTRSVEPRSHRTLTVPEVQSWPLADLATMRFHQLGDEQLAAAIDRLVKHRAWEIAERALDELTSREHLAREARDRVRYLLFARALHCRRWDLVANHVKRFISPRFSRMKTTVAMLSPVIERAPDAIDHLLRFVERVVHDPEGTADGGLTLVLHAMPALGILLFRAGIASGAVEAERDDFIAIDQARVRLGLLPGDPAEAMFDQWQAAKAKARDDQAHARAMSEVKVENDALRAQLSDVNRQNRDLIRRIDDLERRLRERPVESAPAEAIPDPAELRALRARIDQLQEIVRDKNLELAELRRDSRSGSTERNGERDAVEKDSPGRDALDSGVTDDRDDRWEIDSEQALERRIRVPIWRPAPTADIESLPAHVAREALRTIAELAAGDSAAWRTVKRPKGMTTLVRMARIGIHHRLLFYVNDSSLEITELISRESLNVTLKRYT